MTKFIAVFFDRPAVTLLVGILCLALGLISAKLSKNNLLYRISLIVALIGVIFSFGGGMMLLLNGALFHSFDVVSGLIR